MFCFLSKTVKDKRTDKGRGEGAGGGGEGGECVRDRRWRRGKKDKVRQRETKRDNGGMTERRKTCGNRK